MEEVKQDTATTAMMAGIEFRLVKLVHQCTEVLEKDLTGNEFEQLKTQLACAQILSRIYCDLKGLPSKFGF